MAVRKETSKLIPINMRVDIAQLNLIDMAAVSLGSDRTDFIVDAACRHAQKVLLDKRMLLVDSAAFDTFSVALESNRVGDNACLMKLMHRPKPWV